MSHNIKSDILRMLTENARLPAEQIAMRLDVTTEVVENVIEDLEKSKSIVAYKAILNPDIEDDCHVDAIIQLKVVPKRGKGFDEIARRIGGFPEVKTLYLMSGGTDFLVFMEAPSIKYIARFVTEKLAPLEDVQSTMTHFLLKKYKKDGAILSGAEPIERLAVSP